MKRHLFLHLLFALCLSCSGISADTYEVYLLAGQSNMDGRGLTSDLSPEQRAPFKDVTIFYRNPPHTSDGWQPLGPGFSVPPKYKGEVPSHKFGPELGFARSICEKQIGRKVALIKGSKGGSNLRVDWNPGIAGKPETQGERYRFFRETIKQATSDLTKAGHTVRLRGLLWHQGESDSKLAKEGYEKRLVQFIARIREDVGVEDLPIVVGEVFDNGKRDNVRAALRAVGTSGGRLGFVSSEGLTCWDAGTHFDAASQLEIGKRYASEILRIENEAQHKSTAKAVSDSTAKIVSDDGRPTKPT